MHPTAEEGFRRMLDAVRFEPMAPEELRPLRVLDVGGADVNGTVHRFVRSDIPHEPIVIDVLDIEPGPGVTIVADATDPQLWPAMMIDNAPYDLVITTETFEHVEAWPEIVKGAATALRPGGWFVGTCAGMGRRSHGARGAHWPAEGEWYSNVGTDALAAELLEYFKGEVIVEYSRRPNFPTTCDLYWRAQKAGS